MNKEVTPNPAVPEENHALETTSQATLDKLVALCKRRGFVFQAAEIYGGLNGVYEMGHLGTLMKKNIRDAWLRAVSSAPNPVFQMEGALLGNEAMWNASGHTANFHDPLVDCLNCKHRFRADDIDTAKSCPHCGKKAWTETREFQLMFKTQLGAASDQSSVAYLRPETAQAIFVNFKNMMTSNRAKIPFGVAQVGKAFRNEITPKQFLFRMREFEQMEIEWFCTPDSAAQWFTYWIEQRKAFYTQIGITPERIRIRPHAADELSHYSQGTSDVEYRFPFGWKELEGIANRGNFDLTQHGNHSGKELAVFDDATRTSFVPHVIECSVGVDRLFLTLLFDAYHEELDGDETRIVLKLHPTIAPVKVACFPLTKAQEEATTRLFTLLKKQCGVEMLYDASGSIGKRYRRQDEIGTPWCITYDFESEQDHCVTLRDRDTMRQERIPIDQLVSIITSRLAPHTEPTRIL